MLKHWMDTVHALLPHDSLPAPKLRHILDNVDWVLRDLKGQLDLVTSMTVKDSCMACNFRSEVLGQFVFTVTLNLLYSDK